MSALHGVQPEGLTRIPPSHDAICYDEGRRSIVDVIRPTSIPCLDLVPANLGLREYGIRNAVTHDARIIARGANIFYTRISEALKQVDDRYDVVVIDCPPQLGFLTLSSLMASTAVLVTIHPQMLDVMSMSQFLLMLGGTLKRSAMPRQSS